jgi:hypothetical protein
MPKKPNPSKVASAMKRTEDAVEAAVDGRFGVGRVEKKLGHGTFTVRYGKGASETCQVAICGKVLRGGKTSDFHADLGDWIVYDGTEVQGIITSRTPDLFKRLKKARRIPMLPDLGGEGVGQEDDEFGFEFEADVDAEEARETYLGSLEGARSLAEADEMVRAARVAASRANAYRNRRAHRDDRIAAALAEDPEVAAQREWEAEQRAARSAADRERARAAAASRAVSGAGPVEEAEMEAEAALPKVDCWEEVDIDAI